MIIVFDIDLKKKKDTNACISSFLLVEPIREEICSFEQFRKLFFFHIGEIKNNLDQREIRTFNFLEPVYKISYELELRGKVIKHEDLITPLNALLDLEYKQLHETAEDLFVILYDKWKKAFDEEKYKDIHGIF